MSSFNQPDFNFIAGSSGFVWERPKEFAEKQDRIDYKKKYEATFTEVCELRTASHALNDKIRSLEKELQKYKNKNETLKEVIERIVKGYSPAV